MDRLMVRVRVLIYCEDDCEIEVQGYRDVWVMSTVVVRV